MKKLICIIITLIMTLSLFPVNAAADDTVYKLHLIDGKAEILNPPANPDSLYSWSGDSNSGNLILSSGYKFSLIIDQNLDLIVNGGTIADAHFSAKVGKIQNNGTVSGGDFTGLLILDNDGTISGGTNFGSSSTILISNKGTITNGDFGNRAQIKNSGTVCGGTFEGTFTNDAYGKIEGSTHIEYVKSIAKTVEVHNFGTISGGTIEAKVYNKSTGTIGGSAYLKHIVEDKNYEGEVLNDGIINGGTFETRVTNTPNGTIEGSAVFNSVESSIGRNRYIQNNGTIKSGTFFYSVENYGNVFGGTYECSFTNYETGTIECSNDDAVKFKSDACSFNNKGTVNGGTFNIETHNSGKIEYGTFTGKLWNMSGGVISNGARFSGKVLNQKGATISQGYFSNIVENCGKIVNGKFGEDSTKIFTAPVINEGEITGGSFRDVVYSINGGTIDESFLKNGLFTLTLKDCRISGINADAISFPTGFPLDMDKSITVTAVEKSGMKLTGWSIEGGTSDGLNYTFDLPDDNATISPIYAPTHTHSYSEEWKSDENGHWHECSCGAKSGYEKHIPETFAAKEPTCTEDGCTSGEECSVCGYVISAQETIPAKGHGETEIRNAVPAEIGKEGYTGDTYCKDCGEKLADGEVIPALEKPKEPDPTPTPTPKPTPVIPSIPTAPSTPSKDKWDTASDRIEKLSDGDSVTIDIKDGKTTVPENIIKQIKGKDIDLILDLGNGMSWTINGKSIDTPKSVNMGVKKGTKNIPASVLNKVTGEKSTIQLSLKYDGEFGFFAELSVDLGKENNGLYAALYHFNEKTNEMELVDQSEINSGKASFTMSHASEYAIVISGAPVYDNVDSASGANDMSETAESGNAAVCIVIAAAFAAMLIAKKKISG